MIELSLLSFKVGISVVVQYDVRKRTRPMRDGLTIPNRDGASTACATVSSLAFILIVAGLSCRECGIKLRTLGSVQKHVSMCCTPRRK